MSQDDLEMDLSAATMGIRGRGPYEVRQKRKERRAVRSGCRLGCCCAFLIFSPAREIPHIEDPGSLYLAALDSQRWPKRITRLMLSTACICKYFVSGQWAVPTGDLMHEPTGNHLQGEPNCQPTEGSQPDGFCAGRQLATVTALSLGCLPGFVKPRWAVMRKRNG